MATGDDRHALHGPSRRSEVTIAFAVLASKVHSCAELRIALQWLCSVSGEVIAEAAIPSMGVSLFLILVGAWSISRSNCDNGRDATEGSEVHLGFIDASNPSGVIANHIAAGILGILGFTNRYPGT